MKCDEAMKLYLELDRGSEPSLEIAAHIAACPLCAREIRRLEYAFDTLEQAGSLRPDRDLAPAVMRRIAQEESPPPVFGAAPDGELPFGKWIGPGLMILLGMLLIPFSTILPGLFGPGLEVSLHIGMGALVTTYMTFFIGSHLSGLRRILRL